MLGAVQQQFAGLRFKVHGQPDGHHNVARFSWPLRAEGAEPVADGTDVVVVEKDGRSAVARDSWMPWLCRLDRYTASP